MNCEKCGRELVSSDYGYYCDNELCELYDMDIFAYEDENNVTEQINEADNE